MSSNVLFEANNVALTATGGVLSSFDTSDYSGMSFG